MKKFEFIEHTADIKFKAYGKTLKEVFENSVLAVSSVLVDNKKINPTKIKRIILKGNDNENFLYELIEEIVYLLDSEKFIALKAKVEFDEKVRQMKVEFFGDNSEKYKIKTYIKSPTYNEMHIKKTTHGWEAQAVLDV